MDNSSFRQVGKEVFGKLCKGSVADACNRLTQPSVLHKFESFLKPGSKKEAFGTSANRFESKACKLPGPGAYHDLPCENPSLSKKGCGGLTNSAPRFKRYQYVSITPGPGSYNQNQSQNQRQNLHSSSSTSTSFTIKSGKSKILNKVQASPAPGQYNPIIQFSTKEVTSVFKSNSKRLETICKESPAPWQYSPSYSLTRSASAALTSVFKVPANAKRGQGNLYDPHGPSFKVTTPGPGEYLGSVDCAGNNQIGKKDRFDAARPSFMFANNGKDRFGKNKLPKVVHSVPAPGEYEPEYREGKAEVSAAVFLSECERGWGKMQGKPPGPAFYKPAFQMKKKSFLMKLGNKWV